MSIIADYIQLSDAAVMLQCKEDVILQKGLMGDARLMFPASRLPYTLCEGEDDVLTPITPTEGHPTSDDLLGHGFHELAASFCLELMTRGEVSVTYVPFLSHLKWLPVPEVMEEEQDPETSLGLLDKMRYQIRFHEPLKILRQHVYIHREELGRLLSSGGRTSAPSGMEKPLGTKERNTLLILIAALCQYAKVDLQSRNSSGRILGMVEEIGASITQETIKTVLGKISDVLKDRINEN